MTDTETLRRIADDSDLRMWSDDAEALRAIAARLVSGPDRNAVLSVLMEKNPHRVEENGRGGYRCAAGDFEVDWTSADRKRIREHVKGFVADKIVAACGNVGSTNQEE